ncbi:hypothetical protein WOLCODRAFT_82780 [Wolfiporia cocos MD-104 SS10]|uniref:Uncharacterized protein n=1 Tax=Wolfiporia cocos (strain MD-104) TaxID=742152 RepID=A0A2H3J381_WOLCO|nr:hypothetical protein WOLCODRAFT_82780 [Wolfiporia cocos MD-104 SS10]
MVEILEEELRETKEQLKEIKQKLRSTDAELRKAADINGILQDQVANERNARDREYQRHRQVVKEHSRTLAKMNEKHENVVDLLETRSAELRVAQTYLTKADNLSDADILRMFEALNSHIYQLSAHLADNIQLDRGSLSTPQTWITEATEILDGVVGAELIQLLAKSPHSELPVCIQFALQSRMVGFANMVISTWNFHDLEHNKLYNDVYMQLRASEDPAVSGRWRALTVTSLRALTLNETTIPRLHDHLAIFITSITLLAGLTAAPVQAHQQIISRYGGELITLVDIMLQLQRAIGEEIISSQINLVVYLSGETFNPEHMEDYNAGGRPCTPRESDARAPVVVLGTMSLGVTRIEKKAMGGNAAGQGTWVSVTLLKPKVVLNTILDELQISGA